MKRFIILFPFLFASGAHAGLITHHWTVGRAPHYFGLVGLAAGDGSSPSTAICLGDDFLGSWIVPLHIYWVVAIANLPILLGLAFYFFRRYRRRHDNAAS